MKAAVALHGLSARKARTKAGTKAAVVLLSGGNPQVATAEGDAPVQAYIAAWPGWKRDLAKCLDALIVRHVPVVRKATKWNSPFYGIEGRGWFLSFHGFTRCIRRTFFRATSLRPVPPGGTGREARWIDIHENDLDETQVAAWVKADRLRGVRRGRRRRHLRVCARRRLRSGRRDGGLRVRPVCRRRIDARHRRLTPEVSVEWSLPSPT